MAEILLKSLAEIISVNSDGTPVLIVIHKTDGLTDIVPLSQFIKVEQKLDKYIIRIRITLKRWRHLKQRFCHFISKSGLYHLQFDENVNHQDPIRWKIEKYESKNVHIEMMIDMNEAIVSKLF